MSAAQIAQLTIILAPLMQSMVIEGGKIIANIKADLSQKEIDKALELSKSASWPALDFGLK